MLEKDIERYLVDKIKQAGGHTYKFVSPGHRGVPDRICILFNRLFFVEVKREGGKISPLQRVEIARLKSLGQAVYVIWSKDDVNDLIDLRREL